MPMWSCWTQAGTSLSGIETTLIDEDAMKEWYSAGHEWTGLYRLTSSPLFSSIVLLRMMIGSSLIFACDFRRRGGGSASFASRRSKQKSMRGCAQPRSVEVFCVLMRVRRRLLSVTMQCAFYARRPSRISLAETDPKTADLRPTKGASIKVFW